MANPECLLCRKLLAEGEKVLRIETILEHTDTTSVGTTGYSPTNQEFIHLDHLKRALLGQNPALPKAGHW